MLDREAALKIAVPFIAAREAFRPSAYLDNGDWSIGYGHRGVKEYDKITEIAAQALLKADANAFAGYIETHIPDQNPNQYAALISLSFNIGLGKKGIKDGFLVQKTGEKSSILALLQAQPNVNSSEYSKACLDHNRAIGDAFLHWIYIGSISSSGLCTRRTLERKLYLTPYLQTPASETKDSVTDTGENNPTKGS